MLTLKQERFVDAYLTAENATEAAIAAGYSSATARVKASQTLRKPAVVTAIADRRQLVAKRHQIDQDRLVRMLLQTFYSARSTRDRIRAARELGLLLGLYPG